MRPPDQALEGRLNLGREPQLVQAEEDARPIEEPHDHALAVDGGDGGDPEVQVPATDLHPNAPVLGEAALGDVHLGHELDPGDDRGLKAPGG